MTNTSSPFCHGCSTLLSYLILGISISAIKHWSGNIESETCRSIYLKCYRNYFL